MVLGEEERVPGHLGRLRQQLYLRIGYLHRGQHSVEVVEQERETGRQRETGFHHGIPARVAAVQLLRHICVLLSGTLRRSERAKKVPLHVLGLYLQLLLFQLVNPSMDEFHLVHLSGD